MERDGVRMSCFLGLVDVGGVETMGSKTVYLNNLINQMEMFSGREHLLCFTMV